MKFAAVVVTFKQAASGNFFLRGKGLVEVLEFAHRLPKTLTWK